MAKRVVGKFHKPFLRFGKEIRRWALINLSRFARLTEDERSKGKAFDGYSRETDVERCSVGDSHSGISLLRPACLPLCPFKSRRQRRTRPVSWLLDKLIGPDGTPIPRIPVRASPPPPPIDRIYLNGYLHSTSSPLLPLPPLESSLPSLLIDPVQLTATRDRLANNAYSYPLLPHRSPIIRSNRPFIVPPANSIRSSSVRRARGLQGSWKYWNVVPRIEREAKVRVQTPRFTPFHPLVERNLFEMRENETGFRHNG